MDSIKVNVCIIGAGFAGLAAGYKLNSLNQSFIILEARNRVGGRVYSHALPDGTLINRGGTWVGAGHERMHSLIKELGLKTHRQYVLGDNLMILNNKIYRYSGSSPRLNPVVLADLGLAIYRLNHMAKKVPLDQPWNCKRALRWDSYTIGSWIDSPLNTITTTSKKMLRSIFTEIFMSNPNEVSLLHTLNFIHSNTHIEWIISAVGGAQQDLVVGGMQSVADSMAAKLGERVRLNQSVTKIIQDQNGISVLTNHMLVKAEKLIIAIPPFLVTKMDFEPSLPPCKTQLLDRSLAGQGIKWHAVYPEPFWRGAGLTGQGVDLDRMPEATIDCTPERGFPGILAGFAFGPHAREAADLLPDERRQIWLNGLIKRFGPKAGQPTFVDEYDWSADPWAYGDMFAHYAPGVLTEYGRSLRVPCGKIHWAGTETATKWSGSIEGAVRSGERAADEILALSRNI